MRRTCPLKIGDQVVHQSHPGRFTVVKIEPRPAMNIYSNIITIRSPEGVELKVLDTTVRKIEDAEAPREDAAATASQTEGEEPAEVPAGT